MAELAGALAGAAGVLTKLLCLFSFALSKAAGKCNDRIHITKNKHRYVPRTEDLIQRLAFLVYIILLLILSVRGCGINQLISGDTALLPQCQHNLLYTMNGADSPSTLQYYGMEEQHRHASKPTLQVIDLKLHAFTESCSCTCSLHFFLLAMCN